MQCANPPLRTIRLYGPMGAKFGRVHHLALDTNTASEATLALCSQIAGFREYLTGAKDRGIGFAVFAGKENLSTDDLKNPVGNADIRIAPIILGSKNGGIFQIILGAALIAASFIPVLAPISPYLLSTGIAMIAGGVVQLLTPMPKGLSSKDRAANTPSYAFNGPINTEAQGHPVPLLYGGPLKVGSAVISAGIDVKENSAAYSAPASGTHGGMGGGGNLNVGRSELQ